MPAVAPTMRPAPWIEVRTDALPVSFRAFQAMLNPERDSSMMTLENFFILFDSDGKDGKPKSKGIVIDESTAAPVFINSNNTRGNFLGQCAIAALKETLCDAPPVPPKDPGVYKFEPVLLG
jgi:hypothetical protein